jgi:hypothetical protein
MGTSSKRVRPRTDDRVTKRAKEKPPASIQPAGKKVGEPAGNLRQRASWFRKRVSGEG